MSEWDGATRLIGKMVKSAVDDALRKIPRTRYATYYGKDGEGVEWAVLEGEENPRPAKSSSCEAAIGDRIRVTIADGDMTIDSNVSNPGAGVSTVAKVDDKATVAKDTAEKAVNYASQASAAATFAKSSATSAAQQAAGATRSAEYASFQAENATRSASIAAEAAESAQGSAETAKDAAESAVRDAAEAKSQASHATTYANAALDQLTFVEDVAGTLAWISDHGEFKPTEDESVQPGTVYFVKDGDDYSPVIEPKDEDIAAYYVLDVRESQSAFILAHLAVTTRGLWVLPSGISETDQAIADVDKDSDEDTDADRQANANARQAPKYKTLLSNDGMYVYDGEGVQVAKYGESIDFSSVRSWHVGSDDAYILYTPATGSTPASLVIGGASIQLGSGKTLTQQLAEMQSTLDTALQPEDVDSIADSAAQAASAAVADDIADARKVAKNYLSTVDSTGLMVHPENMGPNDTVAPTGWRIADALELLKNGVSYIKAWLVNDTTPTVRVGVEDSGHIVLDNDQVNILGLVPDGGGELRTFTVESAFFKYGSIATSYSSSTNEIYYRSGYFYKTEFTPVTVLSASLGETDVMPYVSIVRDIETQRVALEYDPGYYTDKGFDIDVSFTAKAVAVSVGRLSSDGMRIGREDRAHVDASGDAIQIHGASSFTSFKAGSRYWYTIKYNIPYNGNLPYSVELPRGVLITNVSLSTSNRIPTSTPMYPIDDNDISQYGEADGRGESWAFDPQTSVFTLLNASVNSGYTRAHVSYIYETPSVASGVGSQSDGGNSFAMGEGVKASGMSQTVLGRYNVEDAGEIEFDVMGMSEYAFIIGNGTSDTSRSNALMVDWAGNICAGNADLGGKVSLKGSTSNSIAYNSTGPKIQFSNYDGSQNGQLIYTDYDVVDSGASLTFVTDQPQSWFRAPYIRALNGLYSNGDVISNGQVLTRTRVKGACESEYRTGDVNITPANVAFLGSNVTGGTANDTRAFWVGKGTGYAYFSVTGQLNGQPTQWGFLLNVVAGNEVHQEFWVQSNGAHYKRGGNASTAAMPSWERTNFTPLDAYPVGAIYISVNSTSPATLFGGTWERITGKFLLSATDGGAAGGNSNASIAAGNTGGEASHTLSSGESGVPAHAHTVPAHGHGFTQPTVNGGSCTISSSGGHTHAVTVTRYMTKDVASGSAKYASRDNGASTNTTSIKASIAANTGAHTHTVPGHTHSVSGGAVSDKAAFSTNDNTAANASSAHNNMPPYLAVYMWKRTA